MRNKPMKLKSLSLNPNSLRTNIWRCVEMKNNGWRVGGKQMIKKWNGERKRKKKKGEEK